MLASSMASDLPRQTSTATHTAVSPSLSLSNLSLCLSDMEELEGLLKENSDKRVKLIISDGVFSMDGNLAPLRQVKCCVELEQCLEMVNSYFSPDVV